MTESSLIPSPYTSCLHARPRRLCGLHRLFRSYVEGLAETSTDDFYRFLLDFWNTSLQTLEFAQWADFLKAMVHWFRERKHVLFDYQYDRGALSTVTTLDRSILIDSHVLHPINRFQIYTQPKFGKPLPRSAIMFLALFHDILKLPGRLVDGAMYRGLVPGMGTAAVRPEGVPQIIWPLPTWELTIDYFLFEEGWNELWNKLAGSLDNAASADRYAVWFVQSFLSLVISIMRERKIPRMGSPDSGKTLEELSKQFPADTHEIQVWLATLLACVDQTATDTRTNISLQQFAEFTKIADAERAEGRSRWQGIWENYRRQYEVTTAADETKS